MGPHVKSKNNSAIFSATSLYQGLGKYALTKKEMLSYFRDLKIASTSFWEVALGFHPSLVSFWMKEELYKAGVSYTKDLDLKPLEDLYALIGRHYAPTGAWSTEEEVQAFQEGVTAVARQLQELDVSQVFRQYVLRKVSSEKGREDLEVILEGRVCVEEYVKEIGCKYREFVDLQNLLVLGNFRYAIKEARKHMQWAANEKIGESDLAQNALIGLIESVHRFDPDRGFAFTTYASYWIRMRLDRGRGAQGRTVPQPGYLSSLQRQISKVTARYRLLHNRKPTLEELCDEIKSLTPESFILATGISVKPAVSLNEISNEDNDCDSPQFYQDLIREPSLSGEEARGREQILDALYEIINTPNLLGIREKEVISSHYGLGTGVEEPLVSIGRRLGVTRQRSQRIRDDALDKIRGALLEKNIVKEDCLSLLVRPEADQIYGMNY